MLWTTSPGLRTSVCGIIGSCSGSVYSCDVEVLLDDPSGVGEERPLGADRGPELLERVVLVGRDGGDPGVGHRDLRVEGGELEMLLVLLRAVVAAGEGEDQRVVALDLAEPAGDVLCGRGARSRGTWRRGRCRSAWRSLSVGGGARARSAAGRAAGRRRCRTSRRSARCWSSGGSPAPRRRPGRRRARSAACARSSSRRSSSPSPSSDADSGVSTKPAAIRLTRTGAISSARLAVRAGSAAVARRDDPHARRRYDGRRCRP